MKWGKETEEAQIKIEEAERQKAMQAELRAAALERESKLVSVALLLFYTARPPPPPPPTFCRTVLLLCFYSCGLERAYTLWPQLIPYYDIYSLNSVGGSP